MGGNARGQRENRQGDVVAADFEGGRTAFSQGDDGFGVNRARHADRAAGNRQVGADGFGIIDLFGNAVE